MKVAIVGAGYVGLVTGTCLASLGHEVRCVDLDPARVARINAGDPPIHEQGLPVLLKEVIASGAFRATCDLTEAMGGADLSMIAVGTPDKDGRIDLSHVLEAARQIGVRLPAAAGFHTVVVKSTVVPGTTEGPVRAALETASGLRAGEGFGLGMNPEFLREGTAVDDFRDSDRIVVGALDDRSASALQRLYDSFPCPKLQVSPTNAELIKYASNALLATLISFSNEIFSLAEALPGGDGRAALEALHLDRRWAAGGDTARPAMLSYLMGGIGYGGSCLPKDTHALQARGADLAVPTPVLDGVIRANELRPQAVVGQLARRLGGLEGKTIAMLGLAFKPDTDDARESPALPLIEALLAQGARVRAWDPLAGHAAARWGGRVVVEDDPAALLRGAHAALIATAWPELKRWDWPRLLGGMANQLVLDGRNHLSSIPWPAGVYQALGRGPVPASEKA